MNGNKEKTAESKKNLVYVVGIGPGSEGMMTQQARRILENCDVIIGYTVYVELLRKIFPQKEYQTTPMRREEERCRMAFREAQKGRVTAMVCSGDAGVYGLAGLMFEVGAEYPDCFVKVIPGVTAALAGGALLGAPLGHDFAVVSLSDLLTPWETIEKRLRLAAMADLALCIYNPSSKKRGDYLLKACDILLEVIEEDRVCGLAFQVGREGEQWEVLTLKELRLRPVDMFTTVFIGNSTTKNLQGKMVTPRGYRMER
ncbi:precorrin-3B C(17)-methyltransferase [Candidatus Ventrimonas sp. KK005]